MLVLVIAMYRGYMNVDIFIMLDYFINKSYLYFACFFYCSDRYFCFSFYFVDIFIAEFNIILHDCVIVAWRQISNTSGISGQNKLSLMTWWKLFVLDQHVDLHFFPLVLWNSQLEHSCLAGTTQTHVWSYSLMLHA